MKNLTQKIYKDTFYVIISNIINYGSTFVLAVMISRFLGIVVLGQFTFIFAFTIVLSVITDFGLSTLLIRKINEDRNKLNTYISKINSFKIIAGIISIVILLVFVFLLSENYFNLTLAAGIAVVVPKAVQATYESSIRALLNQAIPSIIKSTNSLLQLGTAYYLLIQKFHLFEIMLVILLFEIITAFVFKFVNKILWKDYDESVFKAEKTGLKDIAVILKESFPFFGNSFLALSIPRITIILLGYITSVYSVGIFSAASRFANGIGLFSGALFNSYYPAMSNPETGNEQKYDLTKKLSFYAFGAGVIIAFALYFFSGYLIDITFKIDEVKPVLKILSFTVIPVLTYTVLISFLFSVHKEKFILKLYLFLWIINIVLGVILIKSYDYTGAAIITVIIEFSLLISLAVKFYSLNFKTITDKLPVTT